MKLLIVLCTLIFLSGCTSSNEGQSPGAVTEPTYTEVAPTHVSTNTSTPNPTAMPSATTEATTPLSEVIQERPISWFDQHSLLELAKEVNPSVSWTTAECVGYEEERCLTSVNLDPNGDGTKWLVAPPLSAWNPEKYRSNTMYPARLFGYDGEYTLIIMEGLDRFQYAGSVVLSDEGWGQYLCMYWNISYPPEGILFALPLDDTVAKEYAEVLGLEIVPIMEAHSVTECGG